MRASAVAIRNTGVTFGEFMFSLFTLAVINAIVIIPAALVIREVINSAE